MEFCMILFSVVDELTTLTKWPVLPFTHSFSENECNKFNCWDFKLSSDVNTVHSAAISRKLQQQEKVLEYLGTPPKKGLAAMVAAVGCVADPRGGWGLERGCSPWAIKKLKMLPKKPDISVFSSLWWVFKYFWRQVYLPSASHESCRSLWSLLKGLYRSNTRISYSARAESIRITAFTSSVRRETELPQCACSRLPLTKFQELLLTLQNDQNALQFSFVSVAQALV